MKNTNELLDTLNKCLEYMESREDVIDGETPSPNKEMTLAIELREAVEYLEKQQEEHDREMEGFLKYAAQMQVSSSKEGLLWEQSSLKERISIFRNRIR